eukprot:TRINITY_DN28787_c0_g1_i1.p1 TRINITY_DN28787_c0_g1~~TRINITY_DN28787_c0_g1_i1.p1  ORF type:complete len:318 (+),score=53.60 TRINITY_DN28787_c0_g1_i1:44-997(+)
MKEYEELLEAIHDPEVIEIADAGPGQEGIVRAQDDDGMVVGIGSKTLKKVAVFALRNPSRQSDEVMLVLNAEYAPSWNNRAKWIEKEGLNYENEIRFSNLALRRTPKSHEGWKYRCWLSRIHGSKLTVSEFRSEVDFCLFCCDRYLRNYYSWAHLLSLYTEHMEWVRETRIFERMREWISTRPTDHSSLSFVQALFQHCEQRNYFDKEEVLAFLSEERTSLQKLMSRRPGLEATWAHLRWVTLQHKYFIPAGVVELLIEGLEKFRQSAPLDSDDPIAVLEKRSERKWSARYCKWVLKNAETPDLTDEMKAEITAADF